jgi:hypothetical protein
MKTVWLSIACAGLLYAATLQDVQTLYDDKAYSQVLSTAAEMLKNDPYNVALHLLSAKAALATNELKAAVLHAKSVIEVDRNNAEAYTIIGDALVADGKPENAKRFHDIAQNLRNNGPKTNQLNVLVSLGGGYDTNVNSHPGSGEMNEYYVLETVIPAVITDKASAGYLQEMLFASHVYDADSKSPFSYKSQVMLFNKNVIDKSEYNSQIVSLKSGAQWNMGTYEIWLPVKITTMRYGNDDYTATYAVEPSYARKIARNYSLTFNAKAERTVYDDRTLRAYDFERYGALIGVERGWNGQKLYAGYRYFNASARHNSAALTFADSEDHGISLKYSTALGSGLKANVQYHYDRKTFDDVTYTTSTEKRKDNLNVLKAELNYMLNQTSFVNAALKYVDNDSNYLPLDYSRTDLLMTYNILF